MRVTPWLARIGGGLRLATDHEIESGEVLDANGVQRRQQADGTPEIEDTHEQGMLF